MSLRIAALLTFALCLAASGAQAQECPPDCPMKGGGASVSDCLLEFDGITPDRPGSRVVSCVDGDPSCDHDPALGVCGFDVKACINNADPSLPMCSLSGVDFVRVVGGGADGRALRTAVGNLSTPTADNVCTDDVRFSVPIRVTDVPTLGRRRFSLSNQSIFQINTLPLAIFSGFVEFEAGPIDPETGFAPVHVVDSSEYLQAGISFGISLALCIKPVKNVPNAGVIACKRRVDGRVVRATAYGPSGTDRDLLLLKCLPGVNYTTLLESDHNIGVVGEAGFTAQDCTAAGGSVEGGSAPHAGVCNGPFEVGQYSEFSTASGELFIAPVPELGLTGFPVEIVQEDALPCGDEEGGSGMSVAIALTTMRSGSRILDANASIGAELEFSMEGEPFDCDAFTEENGPGVLVFTAPQYHLPVLGDGVTQFRFSDR